MWTKTYTPDEIKRLMTHDNILEHIGLEFIEVGQDYLKARIPVDHRTHQIHGILHGGATCVLAETVGSVASLMCIDTDKYYAVGSVITCNHLRPASSGYVTATCRPTHVGKTKHVWDIRIENDQGKLIARAELTCAITPKS